MKFKKLKLVKSYIFKRPLFCSWQVTYRCNFKCNFCDYWRSKIDPSKEIVLFCAGGLRSALAAKSLQDMGFKNVSHVDGGFSAIKDGDFEIS